MNFLAHSSLAFDDTSLVAGQFAGDFVRGTDLARFPVRVASGIRLHRGIDAFTDAHPVVVAARREFEPELRRYAGIVMDVVFDHWLAREWPAPHGRDLASHAAWVDTALSLHASVLPPALERFRVHIEREGVLAGNADIANVAVTLQRLSRRSPRMAPLALAAARIERLAERLHDPFRVLWPALCRMARERHEELRAREPSPEPARTGERGTATRRRNDRTTARSTGTGVSDDER